MPGSQNCSLNSLTKPRRNVFRVYFISVKKCKVIVKNYFGFDQEFSELFDCWAFCLLKTVTGSVITQERRERGEAWENCQKNF